MIRIAIVDDHEIVRQGLQAFLTGIKDFELVAEGSDGNQAVDIVKEHQPDVLLLDMILPELSGLEALQQIQLLKSATKVLILSSFSDANTAIPAVKVGAAGYLLKDINPNDLVEAIREVNAGALKLHPDIAALVVSELTSGNTGGGPLQEHNITERETEVIRLIGTGLSNKEIAFELSISLLTVKTHVSHILEKLELDDRTQVAIFAIRNKLVDD